MRYTLTLLFLLAGLPYTRAQLKVEAQPSGGFPIMLSGRNVSSYGQVTGRLQVSYKEESAIWAPYLAASLRALEVPLRNKEMNSLSMAVLNTSFKVGLSAVIKSNEERRYSWTIDGGIGLCMLRPDEATLRMGGQDTYLGYTTLKDKAWFPEVELGSRWVRYVKDGRGWYFGAQALIAAVWFRDNGVRYTTEITGTTYNLNLRDVALLPSLGGVIGYHF